MPLLYKILAANAAIVLLGAVVGTAISVTAPQTARQRVRELHELTMRALEDVRRIALELRPSSTTSASWTPSTRTQTP